jgi:hypothetical protein
MRFALRTTRRDRPVGKGRVRVNPSPGFVGDRGSYQDLHARRPKGLGGFSTDIEQVTSAHAPPAPPISMLLFCHIHFQSWDSTCNFSVFVFFTLSLIAITPSKLKLGAGATDSESPSHSLQELFIDYFSQVWTDARRIS